MGYTSDLGEGVVKDIDPITGYPRDEWRHLLSSLDTHDGRPIVGWDKPGTRLPNITSPYGFLSFVIGGSDDFHCFDYEVINAGPRGQFIVLHSVINSEGGGFIQDGEYTVLPCNSAAEKTAACREALGMVDQAMEWVYGNDLRHSRKGWNQEPAYFAIAVCESLFPWRFSRKGKKVEDRAIRYAHKVAENIALECAYPTGRVY